MLAITILGCGAAEGVPRVGCVCEVCRSNHPRNKRTRQSIYIESKRTKLLIDASPDIRAQALTNKIRRIDKLLITHPHSDHIGGLQDLRGFCLLSQTGINLFACEKCLLEIKSRYGYLFAKCRVGLNKYVPILYPHLLIPGKKYNMGGIKFIPFMQFHGESYSLGFVFDNFSYSTDMKSLDEKAIALLKGTPLWIVDCTGDKINYPAHTGLKEILALCKEVRPKKVILIHMSHEIDYVKFSKILPKHIKLAYDGMKINV